MNLDDRYTEAQFVKHLKRSLWLCDDKAVACHKEPVELLKDRRDMTIFARVVHNAARKVLNGL